MLVFGDVFVLSSLKFESNTYVSLWCILKANIKCMIVIGRETTSTTCVGMNEGHFTLVTAMSSYVNPKWIDKACDYDT